MTLTSACPAVHVEIAPGDTWDTASPTWVDITADVRAQPGITIRRVRQGQLDTAQAGTMSLRIGNTAGDFTPGNTSGAYTPDLDDPRGIPIRVYYTWGGTDYPRFRGVIEDYQLGRYQTDHYVDVTALGIFSQLANRDAPAVSYASELSNTRFEAILDAFGFPAALRSIETGDTLLQAADALPEKYLARLGRVVDSEFGTMYEGGDGSIVYLNRNHASIGAGATAQATFGGSGQDYLNVVIGLGMDRLYNAATVQREGSTDQAATNTASIAKHGRQELEPRRELWMETDDEAAAQASWIVFRYTLTGLEVRSLTIQGHDAGTLYADLLGIEIGDRLRVVSTVPGYAIDTEVIVEGISEDTKDKGADMQVTFACGPGTAWTFLVVDQTAVGVGRVGYVTWNYLVVDTGTVDVSRVGL